MVAQLGPTGEMIKDGAVTPDGYAVNTSFSVYQPHPPNVPAAQLVPPQTAPTIGDRLNEKGISWAWYSGGWNAALAGNYGRAFQFHHQPFAYFRNYGDGTEARRLHLKDETDSVCGDRERHPAGGVVLQTGRRGQRAPRLRQHRQQATHGSATCSYRLATSPMFGSMAIIVTYDENGGFWDHVPPPGSTAGGRARACRRSSFRPSQSAASWTTPSTTRPRSCA